MFHRQKLKIIVGIKSVQYPYRRVFYTQTEIRPVFEIVKKVFIQHIRLASGINY